MHPTSPASHPQTRSATPPPAVASLVDADVRKRTQPGRTNEPPPPHVGGHPVGLRVAFWTVLCGLPSLASAHPGHGWSESGWTHLLLSPYHLMIGVAVGAALFAAGTWLSHGPARRLLRRGGAALAVLATLVWVVGL